MSAVVKIAAPPLPAPATPRLAVRDLHVALEGRVVLDDMTLQVAPGEIVGVLGPNGSGKSTLIRCLAGTLRGDRGTVSIDGTVMTRRTRELRARMGVVFQQPGLDGRLTCRDNLALAAALFAVPRAEARARAEELLQFMELAERATDPARWLSGGMRRRLEIARALIHGPALLLLDEPTGGLDPAALARVWSRLTALREAQGLGLLVATHNADEAQRCDRLVVIDRGHIVADDTPRNLLSRVAGDVIALSATRPEALAKDIAESFDLTPRIAGGRVLLEVAQGHAFIPRLVEALPVGRLDAVELRRPSVADAFFHLTGRGLEDEKDGRDAKETSP